MLLTFWATPAPRGVWTSHGRSCRAQDPCPGTGQRSGPKKRGRHALPRAGPSGGDDITSRLGPEGAGPSAQSPATPRAQSPEQRAQSPARHRQSPAEHRGETPRPQRPQNPKPRGERKRPGGSGSHGRQWSRPRPQNLRRWRRTQTSSTQTLVTRTPAFGRAFVL